MTPAAPARRFYKIVDVVATDTGFAVRLDGATPKTPGKNPLILPNEASARLVAAEWDAQGKVIDPFTMPITRLVNVGLDRGEATREAMVAEVAKYAGTDLVCYRVTTPDSLVAAQAKAWDPLLDWARAELGVALRTTTGALAIDQPETAMTAIAIAAQALPTLKLTALAFATGIAGSALVAFALIAGRIDGETAFKAIRVEEDWQAERWGRDPDEAHLANARRLDLIAVEKLALALDAPSHPVPKKTSGSA